jgi:tripartite-type tricarboxylate transporter receptor subunit TctC
MNRFRLFFAIAAVACCSAAAAQNFPARPVAIVVPFSAGGPTDTIARIMAERMRTSLGQIVIVENVTGAAGTIGVGRVARAAPDGYTILLHQVGLAAGMTLYPNPSFDAEKDLTGIGIVNTSASTITGRKTLSPNTMSELVRWMKEPGRNAKVAHAGVGAFGHLCGVLFVNEVGANGDQIPYRGGGPALNDLVAGHADISCLSAAVVAPQVQAGNLKVYAIVDKKRYAGLPDTPTMGEAGYKNMDLVFWHILFAPAGTPRPIIDRLNLALRHALADPKVKEAFDKNAMDLYPADQETPEIATAMLKSEIKRWGDVIRANKITAQ